MLREGYLYRTKKYVGFNFPLKVNPLIFGVKIKVTVTVVVDIVRKKIER